MNQAFETSKQEAFNESQHYQTALSNFAHRAIQLSQLQGHDLRLGDGVSASESGQYSKALSTISHIAQDVASRTGVSQDEALTQLTSMGLGSHAGIQSSQSLIGKLAKLGTGFSAGGDAHIKFDRNSTSGDRYHSGVDSALSTREAHDFHDAMNVVANFSKTHHFDESHSTAASLSNQLGADLREAETASHNVDASLSKATRINTARHYVESNGAQIATDLNQAFPAYVASRVGAEKRDVLFASPGNLESVHQLQALGNDFIAHQRDHLIAAYGNQQDSQSVDATYKQHAETLAHHNEMMGSNYQHNHDSLVRGAHIQSLGVDPKAAQNLQQSTNNYLKQTNNKIAADGALIHQINHDKNELINSQIKEGKYKAKDGAIPNHAVDNTLEFLHIKPEEK